MPPNPLDLLPSWILSMGYVYIEMIDYWLMDGWMDGWIDWVSDGWLVGWLID